MPHSALDAAGAAANRTKEMTRGSSGQSRPSLPRREQQGKDGPPATRPVPTGSQPAVRGQPLGPHHLIFDAFNHNPR